MRLLVVEDDLPLAQVIQRGLVEEGHAVDLEGTASGAEYAVSINEYDLVILDLGLPDGDGLSLCRNLRDSESPVRVLMLTARDTLTDKVAGLDAGADDYLAKPFDFAELSARVRALLRRPARATAPVLTAGDVRLDPAARRVWRGDVIIPLTAREFSLLHYMLSRKGEALTRSDILEHVWDAYYDGFSNVVDVHVASLRRKLDLPGSPAPIETLRGAGYRIGP
jgi:DNA-binding response OmpR family regulator